MVVCDPLIIHVMEVLPFGCLGWCSSRSPPQHLHLSVILETQSYLVRTILIVFNYFTQSIVYWYRLEELGG